MSNKPTALPFGQRKMAFTVDVEDYFQVGAFFDCIDRSDWKNYESRVVGNTSAIQSLLEDNNIKGTFFILGCVAEQHPEIVTSLMQGGHEIACHGYHHHRVDELSPQEFEQDITRAKMLLEDISGAAVKGYRAPCFSVTEKTPWAFDMIAKAGFAYSSSTYPVKHDHYGNPEWPSTPFIERKSGILELPQAVAPMLGRNLPAGGGGYFRLLPNAINKALIARFHSEFDHHYMFYCHPWEIDPDQPKIKNASLKSKFRHYVNLSKMEEKIRALCSWGPFERLDSLYADHDDILCDSDHDNRGAA